MKNSWNKRRLLIGSSALLVGFLVLLALTYVGARAYIEPQLPSVDSLRALQLQVPLRVFTRDGKLIGEFGAERRALLKYEDIPSKLIQAFLSAEDDRFFEHGGVDYWGLLRAAFKLVTTGEKSQGGSTVTMQLARNVFLSSEKTYSRKFREILLAQKIERELSKQEILELYLNKIYLGERAYGVGAAARVYFDKDVKDLTLAEMAVLAALPKAPSRDNPLANPERARERRDYVLRRMRDLDYIPQLDYEEAKAGAVVLRPYREQVAVDAYYVAEMVRAQLYEQYGEQLYAGGMNVITTIDSRKQELANDALRKALNDYDERHGWRGPEARLAPEVLERAAKDSDAIVNELSALPRISDLVPGVVLEFSPETIKLLTQSGLMELKKAEFAWAGLSAKKPLQRGDIVRLKRVGEKWKLGQLPQVQGAFVALDPADGSVLALAGGYDYFLNKFNHVTQARRQVGSGFKPFLYSAALAYGFTPASVFLDAPIVFDDPSMETSWRPDNYGGDFNGPMRLREALVQSRNLVSIRVLQAIGLDYARTYAARFGLAPERLPKDLTMSLGSASYTPLELARAYATIANGGFLIDPYFIDEIRATDGSTIFKAQPKRACPECAQQVLSATSQDADAPAAAPVAADRQAPRVIEPQVIWLINSILHDVTVRGTAAAINQLGRSDLSGKTGTTNDETDAWFNGYQKTLVGVSWVGFDQPQPLGRGEVGGRAALPVWMEFMRGALKGVPQETWPRPSGLVDVRIDPATGKLAGPNAASAIFETVQQDHVPEAAAESGEETTSDKAGVEDLY